jgi:hypothetical protein
VAVSIAVFCGIYAKAGRTSAGLAVARLIEVGQPIHAGDLVDVRVAPSPGLDPVPASEEASVIGRRAAVSLVPGSLLTRGELVTKYSPPRGRSLVGVAVKASQMPASGVGPGEQVDVVLTNTAASGQDGTVLAFGVPVVDEVSSGGSGSDTTVVSLDVPSDVAPAIAAASTSGEVALVAIGPQP